MLWEKHFGAEKRVLIVCGTVGSQADLAVMAGRSGSSVSSFLGGGDASLNRLRRILGAQRGGVSAHVSGDQQTSHDVRRGRRDRYLLCLPGG